MKQFTEDEVLRLKQGVDVANVPTLLMVLCQMTGDLSWLSEPYLPTKSRGLDDNDSGGLPDDIQQRIRDAAFAAIIKWGIGVKLAIESPADDLLMKMMSVTMGETVPAQYAPIIRAELGMGETDETLFLASEFKPPPGFSVVIIGSGISGICSAVRLQKAGIKYTIVERNSDVGGVWLENRYPGAAVDTPNHLYSFSFAPHDWNRYFAPQSEILSYLLKVVDDFQLRKNIRFSTEVRSLIFDEQTNRWLIKTLGPNGDEELDASVVVSAVGAFNKPRIPTFAGMEKFLGPQFHTARWPESVEIKNKKVAVVGNGASAMQVVPAIVNDAASLVVFQHSPQWVGKFDKFQQSVPEPLRYLLSAVPLYYAWYRTRLAWIFNDRLYESLQKDPNWEHKDRSINVINEAHRRQLTSYIESELGDRKDLLDKVVPKYPPFGKRMLLDNGWFRTIGRDTVTLEISRIREVTETSIITVDGHIHDVDVIVWATGFDVVQFISPIELRGRGGVSLHEVWGEEDARAYLGTSIPDFPNFFVLYGPNTQFGHGGSLITVVERQVHYLMTVIQEMFSQNMASVGVRRDVHDEYNARIDATHERMVWTHPGMDTYYRNSKGRVVVNNPFRMQEFWEYTDKVDLADYEIN